MLYLLFPNVNASDINAAAAIEADPIAPVPVAQNLQGIDVGVGIAPQIQPIPVAQGPVNLQLPLIYHRMVIIILTVVRKTRLIT